MHNPSPYSEALRHIYYVIAFCIIAFSLQGIIVDYESYSLMLGGTFDFFDGLYGIGIGIGAIGIYAVRIRNRKLEKATLVMSTTYFIIFFLLGATVSLYSPSVVLSFTLAILSGIVHAYLKKGMKRDTQYPLSKRG